MGTLRAQLQTHGMEDRLLAVLDEVMRVRAEMGYPIMATPVSQLVGIQALLNEVQGERYLTIPDENLMFLAGHYGPRPGPLDQEVLDRAFSTERDQRMYDWSRRSRRYTRSVASMANGSRRGAAAALFDAATRRRCDEHGPSADRARLAGRLAERSRWITNVIGRFGPSVVTATQGKREDRALPSSRGRERVERSNNDGLRTYG